MMKILFITRNRTKRGGHIVLVNLVRELKKQGYDIELVTFKPEGERDFPDCEQLWDGINPNIINIPFDENIEKQTMYFIEAAEKYLKEHEESFDRIILDSWHILLAAIRANIITDKVFQLVQSDPEFEPEDDSKMWKAELYAILPRFPVNKIIVSYHLARIFEERYGIHPEVLPLFIDRAYFDSTFEVKTVEKIRFVSSSSDFNIPTKGLDFLLEKLDEFSGFPFELTLISGREIKRELSGFSFPIHIETAQTPKEMVKILCNQDVYINTSTKESFCLCLAEAIALGMPSIALDSMGNRDYIKEDNCVFVSTENDFGVSLAKMKDIEVRKNLHKHAKRSMQKYTLDGTVDQFKALVGM